MWIDFSCMPTGLGNHTGILPFCRGNHMTCGVLESSHFCPWTPRTDKYHLGLPPQTRTSRQWSQEILQLSLQWVFLFRVAGRLREQAQVSQSLVQALQLINIYTSLFWGTLGFPLIPTLLAKTKVFIVSMTTCWTPHRWLERFCHPWEVRLSKHAVIIHWPKFLSGYRGIL